MVNGSTPPADLGRTPHTLLPFFISNFFAHIGVFAILMETYSIHLYEYIGKVV